PNPANEKVTIQLSLDKSYEVNLSVFDLMGRKLTDLSHNEMLTTGTHIFNWNTTDVEPGIYFYRLNIGNNSIARKIIVTR
ncbi:MAG: hypothetical protein DRH93_21855, partial [Deltaproteobacteria bacterium]